MKYSILVACYNAEKYIARCINSLLNQNQELCEIVVLDDGSTDSSYEILKTYKNKIRLYKQKNQGPSATRNKLIDLAKGKYFMFVDADDYIKSNTIEIIDRNLNKDIDLLKFNYEEAIGDKNTYTSTDFDSHVVDGSKAIDMLLDSRIIFDMACTYVINKDYFKKSKYAFETGKYHEDFGLIPRMIFKAKKVKLINDILYTYYQSEDSITRTTNEKMEFKKAMDILYFFNEYIQDNVGDSLMSYAANAVFLKYKKLDGDYKKVYRKEITKHQVYKYLLNDNNKRKLKKIYYTCLFKRGWLSWPKLVL